MKKEKIPIVLIVTSFQPFFCPIPRKTLYHARYNNRISGGSGERGLAVFFHPAGDLGPASGAADPAAVSAILPILFLFYFASPLRGYRLPGGVVAQREKSTAGSDTLFNKH
jgi:hypothetical protein